MAVANGFYGCFMSIDLDSTRASFVWKNPPRLASHLFCRRFVGGFGLGELTVLGNSILQQHNGERLAQHVGNSHCPRFRILGGGLRWRNRVALRIRPIHKTSVKLFPVSVSFSAESPAKGLSGFEFQNLKIV